MLDLPETILSTLPAASRLKLERHASDREAAFASYRQASDREQEARIELGRVGGLAQRQMDAHPGFETTFPGSAPTKPTPATKERLAAPVEAAKRALQVATDARERAAERQEAFGFLDNVARWLIRTATPGGYFREAKLDPALVKVKGDITAEVATLRTKLNEIDDTFAKVESAPAPTADLKARAFAEIDRMAHAGALKVHPANRSDEPLGLARKMAIHSGNNGSLIGSGGSDVLVWLLRSELKAATEAMIDDLPQAGAMGDDEREKAFADLASARLGMERVEEALISTSEADGRNIARRVDLDPRAYLGIEA